MSKKKGIIYRPDGPALEYSPWGCNLYRGCSHGCTYCYLKRGFLKKSLGGNTPILEKKAGRTPAEAFQNFRKELDANRVSIIADGGIFFSFATDPMLHETIDLTLQCASYAMSHGVPVQILTKATWWANDHMLLSNLFIYRHLLRVGFTLTGHDEKEPGAPSNRERIEVMRKLHDIKITTFASIEPVIDFVASLEMIFAIKDICPEIRIGLLSPYSPKRYDWNQCDRFVDKVTEVANYEGITVHWKESINRFYREANPEHLHADKSITSGSTI